MVHQLFVDMEIEFRSLLGKGGRGTYGGLINADLLQNGFAFAGLSAALAPMYLEAKRNGDTELVTRLDDIISDHMDLGEVDKKSERYVELSKSVIKSIKSL